MLEQCQHFLDCLFPECACLHSINASRDTLSCILVRHDLGMSTWLAIIRWYQAEIVAVFQYQ